MWPVTCGTETEAVAACTYRSARQFRTVNVRGPGSAGGSTNSTTSRMASHGMNAATMAGMLRRSSSPASTANPNAHRM